MYIQLINLLVTYGENTTMYISFVYLCSTALTDRPLVVVDVSSFAHLISISCYRTVNLLTEVDVSYDLPFCCCSETEQLTSDFLSV